LKQWLLPQAKAAFQDQKQKFYNKTLQHQPSTTHLPHEFFPELFEFLGHCLNQPPLIRQQLLYQAHDILTEQITRNIQQQELLKRRLA
jgi:hypothetical protein